jgi:MYXO-CTERM domain-containing protein
MLGEGFKGIAPGPMPGTDGGTPMPGTDGGRPMPGPDGASGGSDDGGPGGGGMGTDDGGCGCVAVGGAPTSALPTAWLALVVPVAFVLGRRRRNDL